jgi:hypothetical protein
MGVTFFYYIRNGIWEAMDCLLYIWLLNIFQMKWYTENFIGLATDIKIKVEMLNFFFFQFKTLICFVFFFKLKT